MLQLILGLILFLGIHSMSIVAPSWRDRCAARSALGWKAFYGLVSVLGIVLIVRGYAHLRLMPTQLYVTPLWWRHVAAVILLPTYVLFLAPYFPGRIKRAVNHPQLTAVMLWAVAHLLVNGTLADVLLFGAFLLWAVADRLSMNTRATRAVPGAPEAAANDYILMVLGLALYGATILWLHDWLIGVKPML